MIRPLLLRASRSVLGLLLALGALGPAYAADALPAKPAAGDLASRIDGIVEEAMRAGQVPGLALAIEYRGQVIYRKGFGWADLENHVPVTPETVFPIGSITKTMTGLAITQLLVDGKLDLDAPVGRYLADLPAPARDIPLRHLLNHTSGLVNYTGIPGFPLRTQTRVTRDEMVHWFAGRPLEFPSGSRYSYTNSGLYLLGLVVEKVSGMPLDQYWQAHVFGPFGMTHTAMPDWTAIVEHRAHGYARGPNGLENAARYDPLMPFAAGAVTSTVDDMLKYRHGVFGEGPTSSVVRTALRRLDRLADGTEVPYSLGCLIHSDLGGHLRIGHSGDIDGFSAHYSYYPDDDLTIILLRNVTNPLFPPISTESKIARAVFGLPAPDTATVPLEPALAAELAGEYRMGPLRFGFDRLGILVQGGTLAVAFGGLAESGQALPLRYVGHNEFVSVLDDEHRFRFEVAHGVHRLLMSYYGGVFVATR